MISDVLKFTVPKIYVSELYVLKLIHPESDLPHKQVTWDN